MYNTVKISEINLVAGTVLSVHENLGLCMKICLKSLISLRASRYIIQGVSERSELTSFTPACNTTLTKN